LAARLKVFAARLGFFDTVVAAPSQKAALEAWGVHQDLFKDGGAAVTQDPAAQVALDHPGVVLRRMAGSADPYAEAATIRAEGLVPAGPGKPKRAGKTAAPAPPPPPDRSALTAAEKDLSAAEAEHRREAADLDARRRALDDEAAEMERRQSRQRRDLEAALAKAQAAFRRAGGDA
jgi:hypothetical protein